MNNTKSVIMFDRDVYVSSPHHTRGVGGENVSSLFGCEREKNGKLNSKKLFMGEDTLFSSPGYALEPLVVGEVRRSVREPTSDRQSISIWFVLM